MILDAQAAPRITARNRSAPARSPLGRVARGLEAVRGAAGAGVLVRALRLPGLVTVVVGGLDVVGAEVREAGRRALPVHAVGGSGGAGSGAPTGYIEMKDGRSRYVPIVRPERVIALVCTTAVAIALILRVGSEPRSRLRRRRRRG